MNGVERCKLVGAVMRKQWLKQSRPEQRPFKSNVGRVSLFSGGRGSGKALGLDTPLPTPSGWTTMGDVRVGDALFDEAGEVCYVTWKSEISLGNKCYRVQFDDGEAIIADADHEWLTWTKAARKSHGRATVPGAHPGVVTTADIAGSLMANERERNHSVRCCAPLRLPDADLPIHPYVLGYWLGDGASAAGEITIGDGDAGEVLPLLESFGVPVTGRPRRKDGGSCATYPLGGKPGVRDARTGRMMANGSLSSALREIGVLRNKHVPEMYLRSSREQRMLLLQGLMDSDGHADSKRRAEFCTTNERLAEAVRELAISLGFKPGQVSQERAKINGRDVSAKHRVAWTPRESVFLLERKSARLRGERKQRERTKQRYIVSCDPVASVAVQCVEVDSPSHLYLAGRSMIPTHNSRAGAQWAADQLLTRPGITMALLAPDYRGATQNALFNETSGLCKVIPDPSLFQWREKRNELTFVNGSRLLTFSSEHPKNMRGPNFNCAWVDEMADLEHGMECWKILNPAVRILGDSGEPARVYLTGTPKATELMLHLIERCERSPDRYELQTGRMMDNAANLDPEFIEDMYSENEGSRYFKQEIEGILLLEAEHALWSLETVERCQRRYNPDQHFLSIAVAVDPAVSSDKKADDTGIIAGALGDDRRAYILGDYSTRGSPLNWGLRLAQQASAVGAATIYYEHNLAGPLIRDVLQKHLDEIDPGIRLVPVHARGKKESRADKVSALYESGKVLHMPLVPGGLDKLEAEMTRWDPREQKSFSPGRIDAMVHLVDQLLGRGSGATIMRPSKMPWGKR